MPLGHWDEGKPAVQDIAANLAMKGFVALALRSARPGRASASIRLRGCALRSPAARSTSTLWPAVRACSWEQAFARYRIWDAKRALDYLVSRPDVDGGKIGCTGCSGGGTVTTYISALDPRIKVAAPSCYMNTFRLLFSGPTGDSEQTVPGFVAAGLDVADYVELFAPKPYLIVSTAGRFLSHRRRAPRLSGSPLVVSHLRRRGSRCNGPSGRAGTARRVEVRERIYDWMIRWLKDGQGDFREEPVAEAAGFPTVRNRSGTSGRPRYL